MKKLNKNTLYLKKMGCNFFVNDDIAKISDLNNYRYYTHNIELKSGEKLDILEIDTVQDTNLIKMAISTLTILVVGFNHIIKTKTVVSGVC